MPTPYTKPMKQLGLFFDRSVEDLSIPSLLLEDVGSISYLRQYMSESHDLSGDIHS